MKVKEFIELFNDLDPEADVFYEVTEPDGSGTVHKDFRVCVVGDTNVYVAFDANPI